LARAIIGGGIGELTGAVALRRAGAEAVVFERGGE
jgi:predicted NAD/FAD-dependent oxidoreductase